MKHIFLSIMLFLSGFFTPPHVLVKVAVKPLPTTTPTITITPTPLPTTMPIYTLIASPTPNTIDCIGPDGKHLQVTEQQCETFNKAWDNYAPYITPAPHLYIPTPAPDPITCNAKAMAEKENLIAHLEEIAAQYPGVPGQQSGIENLANKGYIGFYNICMTGHQ